jgi:hypothetical protein
MRFMADITFISSLSPPSFLRREDARVVAGRLRRQAWLRENGSDFDRPLNYGPLGLV